MTMCAGRLRKECGQCHAPRVHFVRCTELVGGAYARRGYEVDVRVLHMKTAGDGPILIVFVCAAACWVYAPRSIGTVRRIRKRPRHVVGARAMVQSVRRGFNCTGSVSPQMVEPLRGMRRANTGEVHGIAAC